MNTVLFKCPFVILMILLALTPQYNTNTLVSLREGDAVTTLTGVPTQLTQAQQLKIHGMYLSMGNLGDVCDQASLTLNVKTLVEADYSNSPSQLALLVVYLQKEATNLTPEQITRVVTNIGQLLFDSSTCSYIPSLQANIYAYTQALWTTIGKSSSEYLPLLSAICNHNKKYGPMAGTTVLADFSEDNVKLIKAHSLTVMNTMGVKHHQISPRVVADVTSQLQKITDISNFAPNTDDLKTAALSCHVHLQLKESAPKGEESGSITETSVFKIASIICMVLLAVSLMYIVSSFFIKKS